jgi:hypothetical protein
MALPEIGFEEFDRLSPARKQALLVIAIAVGEAEKRGERDLARELCGVILREARLASEEREAHRAAEKQG